MQICSKPSAHWRADSLATALPQLTTAMTGALTPLPAGLQDSLRLMHGPTLLGRVTGLLGVALLGLLATGQPRSPILRSC